MPLRASDSAPSQPHSPALMQRAAERLGWRAASCKEAGLGRPSAVHVPVSRPLQALKSDPDRLHIGIIGAGRIRGLVDGATQQVLAIRNTKLADPCSTGDLRRLTRRRADSALGNQVRDRSRSRQVTSPGRELIPGGRPRRGRCSPCRTGAGPSRCSVR